jgi:hypothetical protein
MTILKNLFVAASLAASAFIAQGKIITVNTADNTAVGVGQTNLVQAINLLADGDTINFNIPGPGPFYLITPPFVPNNGYPAITHNNVTIDGYSQPGALANTNTILGSNTAVIKIVIDSRLGGRHMEDIAGYGTSESAALFVTTATNVNIRGLCFLGPGVGGDSDADPSTYAVSFGLGADAGQVNGCWIGVDLDRTSVFRFKDAVTGFQGPSGTFINGTVVGVSKTASNAAAARAQFNVIVGMFIPIIIEGRGQRISGNFLNVLPDGVHDYNVDGTDPRDIEAFIEIGRIGDNAVIGVDGDGVNDAEERNVFGGLTAAGDGNILEWYGGTRTNTIISGNYIGLAVDGVTRFTNMMKVFNGFNSSSTVRFGSDFDGVSDALEGNVIAMNYPFDALYPNPLTVSPPIFGNLSTGARVSLRGNRLIGNNLPPFSYANGTTFQLTPMTNYYAPFINTTGDIIPVLSTNSNQSLLKGTCALGVDPYTNIIIDVYLADDEGWTNGQKFQLLELSYIDPSTMSTKYSGFPQGRTFLGAFLDNGPHDFNPAVGQFALDIGSLGVNTTSLVTVAANYSADPPGTRNGRTQTSQFANPVTLQPAPRMGITQSGGNLLVTWATNLGTFSIQATPQFGPTSWANLSPQPPIVVVGTNYQASVPISGARNFLRLAR